MKLLGISRRVALSCRSFGVLRPDGQPTRSGELRTGSISEADRWSG